MLLPLLTLLILVLTPLVMFGLRLLHLRFAYFWLVALLGALVSWGLILATGANLPQTIPLSAWQAAGLPDPPSLVFDTTSWPYALAFLTLACALVLTDVIHPAQAAWSSWACSLVATALGFFAVLAGNPLTLLLAWPAIDLIETVLLLLQTQRDTARKRLAASFAIRIGSTVLLAAGVLVGLSTGPTLAFAPAADMTNLIYLAAAALRLGGMAFHLPLEKDSHQRRGFGTLIRVVGAASALVLPARTAAYGLPPHLTPYLLALALAAALYAAISWFTSRDELEGRAFWFLGGAALAVAAAVQGQPEASLAWGTATLFSGALIFLFSPRSPRLLPLVGMGLLTFSALPLTPSWPGVALFSSPIGFFFILPHTLLLAGYARRIIQPAVPVSGLEPWVWVVYPLGLALIPLSHYLTAWFGGSMPLFIDQMPSSFLQSWPALVSPALIAAGAALSRRKLPVHPGLIRGLVAFFSLRWAREILRFTVQVTSQAASRTVHFTSLILEGEAGILWTLLVLTLLLSYLAQRGLGG